MSLILNLADPVKSGIKYEIIHYPDSHSHVEITDHPGDIVCLKCRLSSMNDVFLLLQTTDQLRRKNPGVHIHLYVSYLLCGRYDRPMHRDDSFDLRIITDMLKLQNYHSITVFEPHSDVTIALLECGVEHPLDQELKKWLKAYQDPVDLAYKRVCLVAPDMGSVKRVQAFVKQLARPIPMVIANKTRDPVTGNVTGIEIFNPTSLQRQVFIYDDLCDGGRTFIELAKAIKQHKSDCFITLVVTHGIFSKGFDEILKHVDQIITSNSYQEIDVGESPTPKFSGDAASCVHVIKVI